MSASSSDTLVSPSLQLLRVCVCVFSGDVGRGRRQRESLLHRSVHPLPASLRIDEGQVRRRRPDLSPPPAFIPR